MSEGSAEGAGSVLADGLSGAELLALATDRLLGEVPGDLPEQVALDRLRVIIACAERLEAARLAAVRDVDRRQLWSLEAAGSTRGWLRTQLGGERGQLTAARRLQQRPLVQAALAAGQVARRAAEQLCAVLDRVPAELDEAVLTGVLVDGVGGLLQTYTGGLVLDDAVTPDLLAARAEVDAVLAGCCADTLSAPAGRLEPALVLLARRLAPAHLGPALQLLLAALLPDGSDGDDRDPYFFELRELLDGDVDVRGHLDPETGQALAAEVERRVALLNTAQAADAEAAAAAAAADGADSAAPDSDTDPGTGVDDAGAVVDADDADADHADADHAADGPAGTGAAEGGEAPARRLVCTAGRRRHDALAQLLRDLTDTEPGTGQPAPAALTVITTLDALDGRLGALPGQLLTASGQPVPVSPETVQRMGCYSELSVVLLDALGNPVGASGTHRSFTRRERRALLAQWGPGCAVAGCARTATVPHHADPWWKTKRTRLRDGVPLCTGDHRNLHEHGATLRLRDGRLLNHHGWVRNSAAA